MLVKITWQMNTDFMNVVRKNMLEASSEECRCKSEEDPHKQKTI